jgi:hypothetical protein
MYAAQSLVASTREILTNETRELMRIIAAIWDACWERKSSLIIVMKSYASMLGRTLVSKS